jgi:Sec-independent protein translocase protein TatA
VIGPKKLPELAKSLGRAMGEFKKATREFKDAIDIKEESNSVKKPFSDLKSTVKDSIETTITDSSKDSLHTSSLQAEPEKETLQTKENNIK